MPDAGARARDRRDRILLAGTLGTIALTVSAPFMVRLALRFGPAEYFALAALAFVMVSSVLGDSRLHGYVSLLFGLLLGLIGSDPLSGEPRLSFGIPQLLDGLDVVVVAVGLFARGTACGVPRWRRRGDHSSAWLGMDDEG